MVGSRGKRASNGLFGRSQTTGSEQWSPVPPCREDREARDSFGTDRNAEDTFRVPGTHLQLNYGQAGLPDSNPLRQYGVLRSFYFAAYPSLPEAEIIRMMYGNDAQFRVLVAFGGLTITQSEVFNDGFFSLDTIFKRCIGMAPVGLFEAINLEVFSLPTVDEWIGVHQDLGTYWANSQQRCRMSNAEQVRFDRVHNVIDSVGMGLWRMRS